MFKRDDWNVSSAKPGKINDPHSEIYSLLGQCPDRHGGAGRGGWNEGGHEKEGGRLSGNPQDSSILQDFSKFPSKAIEA